MTRIKTLAVTALLAATIGLGGVIAMPPSAAEARMSCETAMRLARIYTTHGDVFLAAGHNATAAAWYGKA
jgi:hypothetical protein